MSAYSQYRKRFEINPTGNTPTTLGQKLKAESDQIMELGMPIYNLKFVTFMIITMMTSLIKKII